MRFFIAIAVSILVAPTGLFAADGRCVTNAGLGLSFPDSTPAVCIAVSGQTTALVMNLDDGLIIVSPEAAGPQATQAYPGGRTGVQVLDQPSRIVYCPASVAQNRAACLADPFNLRPGSQAFSGRIQMQATVVTDRITVPACPAMVHLEGLVDSPAKEAFHLSASLVLFSGTSGDCGAVQEEVKLSYPRAVVSGGGRTSSGQVASTAVAPETAAVQTPPAPPARNPGNPDIQIQLDAMQALLNVVNNQVTEVRVKQAAVIENTLTAPFDIDANWCFEAAGVTEVSLDTETKTEVGGTGKGGADIYGTGVHGNIEAKQEGGLKVDFKGEMNFPKLSVCVKGPVLKHLEQAPDGLQTLFAEIQSKLPVLKTRLPEVTSHFQVSGDRLEKGLDLIEAFDLDPTNPGSFLGGQPRERIKQLIEAMPLSETLRMRLTNALAMLDNLGEKFKICKQVNEGNFPAGLTNTLQPLCDRVDGENLKKAIENIQTIIETIQNRLPNKDSSVFK